MVQSVVNPKELDSGWDSVICPSCEQCQDVSLSLYQGLDVWVATESCERCGEPLFVYRLASNWKKDAEWLQENGYPLVIEALSTCDPLDDKWLASISGEGRRYAATISEAVSQVAVLAKGGHFKHLPHAVADASMLSGILDEFRSGNRVMASCGDCGQVTEWILQSTDDGGVRYCTRCGCSPQEDSEDIPF